MSWEYKKVKDFTEVITGGTPSTSKREYWENGTIPWLNSGELNQDIITACDNYISESGLKNSNAKIMPKKSVLVALTGATTGKTAYLTFDACANQSVTGILPSKLHNSKYLYHYISSIRKQIINDSYGGAQKHISQAYVKDLLVPLPPLTVQQKIAAVLDEADTLRREDKALLSKYEELLQAVFYDMFGDPVKNEKGWKVKKLGEIGKWQSGGTPSRSVPEYFEGDVPWLSSGELNSMYVSQSEECITEEAVANCNAKIIPNSSLLLGMYDTAALKSCISQGKLTCNQAIAYSKLDETMCNTIFVYSIIQIGREHFRRLQRGVRQKNLNLSMIKEIEILFPPIELQEKFATIVQFIEHQKSQIIQQQTYSENLFQSLIQRAFKGELVE